MMRTSRGLLLAVTICSLIPGAFFLSSGAPASVCKSMIPSHDVDPQQSKSPFAIEVDRTAVRGGDKLKILLTSPNGQPFRGFFIQVRKAGEDEATGTFDWDKTKYRYKGVDCFKRPVSAVTHADNTDKSQVVLEWTAPNVDGDYDVLVTFVLEFSTFWAKVPHSQKLKVAKDLNLAAPTEAPKPQVSERIRNELIGIYKACGTSVGCYEEPSGCTTTFVDNPGSEPCIMLLTWQKTIDHKFQLIGKAGSGQYLATALSSDGTMEEDSVVACSDGDFGVRRFYNGKDKFSHPNPNSSLGLREPSARFEDGILFCSFKQDSHTVNEIQKSFNMDDSHYLLMAYGSRNGDRITYHDHRVFTSRAVSFDELGTVGSAGDSLLLVQLHGSFMIIAWLVCASTGMFTARYLKLTHTDFMPFNKAFWFVLHITCMFTTFVLTVCGIIFIFVKKGGYSKGLKGPAEWHPILGLILTGLAVMQVLIAFFRPHPNTPRRPLFNWVHWSIGNTAHIVGIACIFLAMDLSLLKSLENVHSSGTQHYTNVLIGFVCFHVLMHIVMSVHTLWADKQMDATNKMRAVHPGPMKPTNVTNEAPGTSFRTVMLSLYILGVVAVAITLVIFVSDEKKTVAS